MEKNYYDDVNKKNKNKEFRDNDLYAYEINNQITEKTETNEEEEEKGDASPIGVIFNLLNTTVGAGIVSLPISIRHGGIINNKKKDIFYHQ
jgi:hypothetical protein